MVSFATLRPAFVLGIVVLAAACGAKGTLGNDPNTDSQATKVTWTDGKEAIQINCGMPGGCQTRAVAICGDNYKTLSMQNMPNRGDMTSVRGPASVVIRCP